MPFIHADERAARRAAERQRFAAMKAVKQDAARVAKQLGVTAAGLTWLAKLAATGKGPKRGSEHIKLIADGFVTLTESGGPTYDRRYFITDAGRDVVRRARAMGW